MTPESPIGYDNGSPGAASRRAGTWRFPVAFALSAVLVPVSNGRYGIPIAAWLAPLFLLVFLRSRRPVVGLPVAYALFLVAFPIQWNGLLPLTGLEFWLFGIGIQLGFLLPYAIDRLLGPRVRGFASTLVFPFAWTAVEYVVGVTSPYATWGSVAYTQYGNLPLLQVLSVTGMSGVTFLVCWFGSVGSWAWLRAAEGEPVRHGLVIYGAVLGTVLLAGGARIELSPPSGETVRIASLTVDQGKARSAWRVRRDGASSDVMSLARRETVALHNTLLARSEAEARAGGRVVLWSELNALVLKDDEPGLVERGRDLGRRHRVYLVMALGTITPGQRLIENKVIVIDDMGEVVATYFKGKPVPGDPETGASERLPTIATLFGNLALAICYDMDFPGFIRQAGQSRADLLLVPASDPPGIDPIHTRMAVFRAIENGCSLVRQTDHGLSVATDHQGRVLASMDYFATTDHVMSAHVPTRGAGTIYSRVGDAFALACLGGLALLTANAVLLRSGATRREALAGAS